MKCCVCIYLVEAQPPLKGLESDAITVKCGYTVCNRHLAWVDNNDFETNRRAWLAVAGLL